ncbi:MAG: HlyD family efflux transporter periplasmic adaptor subunit [Acidobacteriota bacterium]
MDRELTAQDRLQTQALRWLKPALFAGAAALGVALLARALEPGVELQKLRLSTVERGDLEAVLTASGLVQPAAERVMSSPIDTRLLRVLRPAGSRVEAGDTLLELDVSQTELQIAQVEGRLDQAAARRTERDLQLRREIQDIRSRERIQTLELEEARFQLEQESRLHEEGLVSLTSLRSLETRVRRLNIELEGLGESLAGAEASRAAQLRGLDAEIRTLGGEREQLKRVLERATARAERAGVVTFLVAEEGSTVAKGEPLAKLADLGSFRIEATTSDLHAPRLVAGGEVRVPVGDEMLRGSIERILPAVEEGAVRFWVDLERPDHPALRPNLRLDVLVVTATRQRVITVRRGPFADGPGAQEVFVLDPSGRRAERRTVELGLAGQRRFEVLSGLEPGERVIISDLSRFRRLDSVELR